MIEVTKPHPEFLDTRYGPIIHHMDKDKVIAKAKEMHGEDFKLGQMGVILRDMGFPKHPEDAKWCAISTKKICTEGVPCPPTCNYPCEGQNGSE